MPIPMVAEKASPPPPVVATIMVSPIVPIVVRATLLVVVAAVVTAPIPAIVVVITLVVFIPVVVDRLRPPTPVLRRQIAEPRDG
jgi:ABC-type transport system involved in Fe-S cluster assembly fused permease/ATPase subunit